MKMRDLLKAQRNSDPPPSLEKPALSKQQLERAAQNLCVECGETHAKSNSYLCEQCALLQGGNEALNQEIDAARRNVLRNC